jgi:hypothetical protein
VRAVTAPDLDLAAVLAELDGLDGHDWTAAAAAWAAALVEECARLRGELVRARARESEARGLYRDIVRSARGLAEQRDALVAVLGVLTHPYAPAPDAPLCRVCARREIHPVHDTFERIHARWMSDPDSGAGSR